MYNKLTPESKVISVIVVSIGLISYLHYSTMPGLSQLHAVYRYFYFFPIVYAALRYGFWGGLLTSLVISFAFIPHILFRWSAHTIDAFNDLLVVAIFYGVAIITGITTDRMRQIQALQEKTAAELATSLHRLEVQGEELRRAERLSSLGTLSGGLAHQIRNPLGIIRASAQLLEMEQQGEAPSEVAIIRQETDRIEDLIQRLLNYAGEASIKPTHFALCDLLTRVHKRLQPIMDAARIKFTVNSPTQDQDQSRETLPQEVHQIEVWWDAHQIEQVFINLCINAVQALNESRHEIVACPGDAEEQNAHTESCIGSQRSIKIETITAFTEEMVTIRVVDNGPGLPVSMQQQIFDPFFTTRDSGTGLGLSVVQRIVDEHHGRIWVKSAPGQGAAFVVQLPVCISTEVKEIGDGKKNSGD